MTGSVKDPYRANTVYLVTTLSPDLFVGFPHTAHCSDWQLLAGEVIGRPRSWQGTWPWREEEVSLSIAFCVTVDTIWKERMVMTGLGLILPDPRNSFHELQTLTLTDVIAGKVATCDFRTQPLHKKLLNLWILIPVSYRLGSALAASRAPKLCNLSTNGSEPDEGDATRLTRNTSSEG